MVNLSFLEKFTKGDSKKMKRYISLYLDVAPKTFEDMKQNLEDEDWERLRINAHSLKPQTNFVGVNKLKEVLIKIENNVKAKNLEELNSLCEKAFNLHEASKIKLQDYLKQI